MKADIKIIEQNGEKFAVIPPDFLREYITLRLNDLDKDIEYLETLCQEYRESLDILCQLMEKIK